MHSDTPHPLSTRGLELLWDGKYDAQGRLRPVTLPDFPIELHPVATFDVSGPSRLPAADRHRLIWGDNLLAMAALLPEFRGRIQLMYLDPPFDAGTDFRFRVPIGDGSETVGDWVAYRDVWGTGADSYLARLYDRLRLARELLADSGSLYLHCDYRVTAPVRLLLEEVFGPENYVNECIWSYRTGGTRNGLGFSRKHDTLHFVAKNASAATWNPPEEKSYLSHRYGFSNIRQFEDEAGIYRWVQARDVWDIPALRGNQPERVDYPTQKPEALLERLVRASSNPGDWVADFYCGSGSMAAVAERLGRRWIAVDLGRHAIQTTHKRLIGVQRALAAEKGREGTVPGFDLLTVEAAERRWWRVRWAGSRDREDPLVEDTGLAGLPAELRRRLARGLPAGTAVRVLEQDIPLSAETLETFAAEALRAGHRRLWCLAWEYEPGIWVAVEQGAEARGIEIDLLCLPRELLEGNRSSVPLHTLPEVQIEPVWRPAERGEGWTLDVRLTRFRPALPVGDSRRLTVLRERMLRSPVDFLDSWAVDYDGREDGGMHYDWCDFRTRAKRSLCLETDCRHPVREGERLWIAVRAVDVFGVEARGVLEVELPDGARPPAV